MVVVVFLYFMLALLFAYKVFDKELTNPAVVFFLVYTVSLFFCVINILNWGSDLSLLTTLILIVGSLVFFLVSFLVKVKFDQFKKSAVTDDNNKSLKINCLYNDDKKMAFFHALVISYSIIILILLYREVFQISSRFESFNSFSEMLTVYKNHTSYSKDAELSNYITILLKPIIAMAYIGMFIFLNNVINSKKNFLQRIKKNYIYSIYPILYFIQKIMESNRGSILNFICGSVSMGLIIWYIRQKWQKTVNIKFVVGLFASGALILILFYFSAGIVGRINNKNMIDYISLYAGGSIKCLDRGLTRTVEVPNIFGEYTFSSTINNLQRFGIVKKEINISPKSQFIYINNIMVGNVYTSYYSWYHDFGFLGVVVLQGIQAFLFSCLYYMIKYNKFSDIFHHFLIILYGFLIYTVFMHHIDSYFYLEFFTIANIGVLMFIVFIYYLLFCMNVDFLDNLGRIKK